MQRQLSATCKYALFKRTYRIIALLLLVAFIDRTVIVFLSNGCITAKNQQIPAEDEQEQNNKPQDGKVSSQKFNEFISPAFVEMPGLVVKVHSVSYYMQPSTNISVPLITVITPPPDILFV